MTVKSGDVVNEGVPREKSAENTIEGTKGGIFIEVGRLKMGTSNRVPSTEVLVVSTNLESWLWLNPLVGSRRVWLFVSDRAS